MGINGRIKGKGFERTVANLLTNLTGVKWHRVPCSGAMATVCGIADKRFQGDLFCDDSKYEDLCIECKATTGPIHIYDFFWNPKSLLWKWWEQAQEEAGDKHSVLVFRWNFGKIICMAGRRDVLERISARKIQATEAEGFLVSVGLLSTIDEVKL